MEKRTGACACGAIRYEVTGEPFLVHNCHCKSCQRLTGTAFKMGSYWSEESVRVVSGDMTTYSRKADSGRTVETKFWFVGRLFLRLQKRNPGVWGLA